MFVSEIKVFLLAMAAGFSAPDAHVATCVAKYESSLRPGVISKPNRNKTHDIGLMQINTRWATTLCRDLNLLDPIQNLKCAKRLFDDVKGFTPWVAYKKNKKTCDNYKVFDCPPPILTDVSGSDEPFNPATIHRATVTCENRYKSCLKYLKRLTLTNYHAICGRTDNDKSG